jgi:plasmid stabilization system protein ParE
MSGYILMPMAQQDLANVREYYLKEAGYRVARQIVVEFVEEFRFPGSYSRRWSQTRRFGGRPPNSFLAVTRLPDFV